MPPRRESRSQGGYGEEEEKKNFLHQIRAVEKDRKQLGWNLALKDIWIKTHTNTHTLGIKINIIFLNFTEWSKGENHHWLSLNSSLEYYVDEMSQTTEQKDWDRN